MINDKLFDPLIVYSLNGAAHDHIRDGAGASLPRFSIGDLDCLDATEALRFFEENLLVDGPAHPASDEQHTAWDLSPTWSLDDLYSEDAVQQPSAPATVTACLQHSSPMSHTKRDTPPQKEASQFRERSSVPVARDAVNKTHPFSKPKFAKNASKPVESHNVDGQNDGKATHMGKPSSSKNIISERKRRRKLNDRLYSLRALVPKISKMDKASIVNDAINYVQSLEMLVKKMQDEIHTLQTMANGDVEQPFHRTTDGHVATTPTLQKLDYKILKVDAAKVEDTTYHLRILCERGHGVFVKLARALEALQFEIVSANLTSINDHILNTIFLKAKDGRTMEPRELREMILEVVPRFGLGLARERERELRG